jgi:hypothetical protein
VQCANSRWRFLIGETILKALIWLALFASGAIARPAGAQLLAALEPAVRHATVHEYNQAGARIVRESGWLPGLGSMLQYQADQWQLFGTARLFSKGIRYEGQLQNGQRFNSETGTRHLQAEMGVRYRILTHSQLVTVLQYDAWKRVIVGNAMAIGLREQTRSLRLRLGVEQAWQVHGLGEFTSGISFIHAAPERLDIKFSGLLDPASLRTRPSRGFALEATYRPASDSRTVVGAQLDYLKTPRSNAHAVTRDGRFAGEITQPEHVRQNMTLFVRYVF